MNRLSTFETLSIYFKVKRFLFSQQIETIRLFYQNPRFAIADALICFSSFFLNPYRACRKFFEKKGEEGVYGETPFSVFQKIAKASFLGENDQYVELGSGRGKTCFWASEFCRCNSKGIECVPAFLHLSRAIAKICKIPAIFQKGSFFQTDLSSATVVYLSTIHFPENEIDFLKKTILTMPQGSRLVTISGPLTIPEFRVQTYFEAIYPWGKTKIYIQKKIS